MTELLEEIKESFEKKAEENHVHGDVPVIMGQALGEVPGFMAMKEYFEGRITVLVRRGYRHFAGATLTHNADELLRQTALEMLTPMLATMFRAFSDGVMVGHQVNHLVRMRLHFHQAALLWQDEEFLKASKDLGAGFADDDEVCTYFGEFLMGGVNHLAHVTGFAHSEVDPAKIWDIWVMGGTACICSSFLAGHKLGTTWRERDVLDGIAIASEEAPGGYPGEGIPDH